MYSDNDILFPHYAIASLKRLGGEAWQKLVERIVELPENHEETIAFMKMMVDLNGCLSCETDSYRAMRGCTACAQQTLRRHKDGDEALLKRFEDALEEVRRFAFEALQYDIIVTQPPRNSKQDHDDKGQSTA
jgi:uncharacterized protein YoaH (UPF0181 family)